MIFCVLTFSDNNECNLGTHNCNSNAACTNTDGSFTCACNTGYSGNGVTCAGREIICVFIDSGVSACVYETFPMYNVFVVSFLQNASCLRHFLA